MLDDFLNIDTPENVAFGYELAGIGSRFLAAAADSVLIVILEVVAGITLMLILNAAGFQFDDPGAALGWVIALFGLAAFGFLWGYYIFFELIWNGQSPGKRWLKLRVLKMDGTPVTLTESIIRNVVRLIDLLPSWYALGVLTMFVNPRSRRLGDLAAGTLVVFDRETVTLESLKTSASAHHDPLLDGSDEPVGVGLPVDRLSEQDVVLAQEFLRRASQLANSVVLGREITSALRQRMELPPEPMTVVEIRDWLVEVVRASSQQRSR